MESTIPDRDRSRVDAPFMVGICGTVEGNFRASLLIEPQVRRQNDTSSASAARFWRGGSHNDDRAEHHSNRLLWAATRRSEERASESARRCQSLSGFRAVLRQWPVSELAHVGAGQRALPHRHPPDWSFPKTHSRLQLSRRLMDA